MRRIYFLLPNVQSAKGIIDELLLKRIEWRHIHVLARPGVRLEDLPQATLAQRSDLLPALARGTAAGGVTGMLAVTKKAWLSNPITRRIATSNA